MATLRGGNGIFELASLSMDEIQHRGEVRARSLLLELTADRSDALNDAA